MKLFEDLPSTNVPITAENLNQIKDNLVVVSPTEPIGNNREKIWMQNTDTEQKIYIKNDNDVYEEFININQQIKTATYEESFTNVSTTTNVDFSTMFPNLSLRQVICFNIEIINVYDTWDRVYANILEPKVKGTLQIRSYDKTQNLSVRVTAFYK